MFKGILWDNVWSLLLDVIAGLLEFQWRRNFYGSGNFVPVRQLLLLLLFQTSLVNQSAVRGQCCDGVFSHRSVDGFSCLLAGVQALLKQPRTLVLPGILWPARTKRFQTLSSSLFQHEHLNVVFSAKRKPFFFPWATGRHRWWMWSALMCSVRSGRLCRCVIRTRSHTLL